MKMYELFIFLLVILVSINNPFCNRFIYIIIPISTVIYVFIKRITLNEFRKLFKSGFVLGIFFIIYFITLYYYKLEHMGSLMVLLIVPLSLFVLGYLCVFRSDSKRMVKIISVISFSSCIYVALSLILSIRRFGIFNYNTERVVVNFWNRSEVINATNMTAFVVLSTCLVGVLVVRNNRKSTILLAMAIVEIITGISFAIFTGGRTAIMILPIMMILTFLIIPNASIPKAKFLLALVIVLTIFLISYYYNIFDLKEILQETTLWKRLSKETIINDVRFDIWKEIIQNIGYDPWGGKQISISLNYGHNLFLDTLFYGGFQSFIFLTLLVCQYLYKVIIIILKDNNKTLCSILSAFSISSMVYFSFEPVLQGSVLMFSIFTFVFGMISAYFYKLKYKSLDKVFLD